MLQTSHSGVHVAFLHPRLEGGGSERVSLTTARRFSLWGIRSTFIATAHNDNEFSIPKDIDASIQLLSAPGGLFNPDNKRALADYILRENIRIVFTCYIPNQEITEVIEQTRSVCKWVYWCHNIPFWEIAYEQECYRNRAKYSLKMWIKWHLLGLKRHYYSEQFYQSVYTEYRQNIQQYDKFITLSDSYRETIVRDLGLNSAESDKLLSLTNTIEIETEPQTLKSKTIVWVGRLEITIKRFDRMLRIWALAQDRLPEWKLLFYGSNPDSKLFDSLCRKYRLKRVHWAGYTKDISLIYNDASILAQTSAFEGFPMVCLEAQNNGVIPITFDSYSAAKDIIGLNNKAGILIPAFDIEGYAEALVNLCKDDGELQRLQENCLHKRYDYAPDVNDLKWDQLFDELLR